jgi:hypothetical protein
MITAYEFWEMGSGNLMDSFDSQEEALDALADAIKRHGPAYADSIMLVWAQGEESKPLGSGRYLADWAMTRRPR